MPVQVKSPGKSALTIVSDLSYPPMLSQGQDLSSVLLYYSGNPAYEIRENIVSAKMDLTTEGSHTVTLQVVDPNRKLLRSGYLSTHTDIRLFYTQHESWWRLMKVSKQGELLTLTFEDRHVQILKSFNKKLLVEKGKLNRCQFVWRLIMEAQAKDSLLDFNGPCIGDPKSKQKVQDSLEGITQHSNPYTPAVPYKPSKKFDVRIKGEKPRADQLKNIDAILNTGAGMKVRRKILVVSIMTAIGESSITNYECVQKYGYCPDGPIGVFQQFHSYGWPASRDVATDAGAYFRSAIKVDHDYPNITYEELGTKTQNSGWNFNLDPHTYLGNYTQYIGQYRTEAEKIVDAWGFGGEDITKHVDAASTTDTTIGSTDSQDPFAIPPGWSAASGDSSTQQWHRGSPKNTTGRNNWTAENSWDCIERMANEVKWYKFMVWDDLWFRPSDDFFTVGVADIEEFDGDVGYIDGDYDRNKRTGSVTINTYSDQWVWLPGQTLNLVKMGPWDGLWWVTEVQFNLIGSTDCQVTLKKPMLALSEAQAEAKGKKVTGGELPGTTPGPGKVKNCDDFLTKVVQYAKFYAAHPGLGHGGRDGYSENRPILTIANNIKPPNLPSYLDCSGLTATCYWLAGMDDTDIAGSGASTYTQEPAGKYVTASQARPGDMVFWGGPDHVAIYIGAGMCISHGSPGGPHTISIEKESSYHSSFKGYRNYCDRVKILT